ncbi:hypothetical protein [Agromyces sp. SYSU T00194]|uniref:hypothetical protein n=1 Tax=Agromyces chitinivorans TaxID=3158560 RepID=UPI0033977C9E
MGSSKKPLPRHGTIQRYRLELRAKKGTCERCRAANRQTRAGERSNKRAADQRRTLHIVDEPQNEPTDLHAAPPTPPSPPAGDGDEEANPADLITAVRSLMRSRPSDMVLKVYGETVILLARAIEHADPKDIPKLAEEITDTVKLMAPPEKPGGGDNDPFASLGNAI